VIEGMASIGSLSSVSILGRLDSFCLSTWLGTSKLMFRPDLAIVLTTLPGNQSQLKGVVFWHTENLSSTYKSSVPPGGVEKENL
jgi:hypothetical protein